MAKFPTWLKMILVLLIFAILYGGAQLLLYIDKASTSRFGVD